MTHQHIARQPQPARTCVACGWRELQPHRPHVCDRCEADIRAWLEELADHAEVIGRALVALTAGRDGKLPIRASIFDLSLPARSRPVRSTGAEDASGESIAAGLGWWAVRWSQIAPASWQPSNSVGSIALWLYEMLDWACTHNVEVREFGQDVRDLLASTRRALNLTGKAGKTSTALVKFTAACIRCGGEKLFAHPAADWIECPGCGSLYSDSDYAEFARAELPDDTPLWAVQAATALGVPVQRIWKWASRGLLEEVDHEGGRPRYRLGDLRDVHRQSVLHQAGRCEIGLVLVTESGEIVPGPLTEYAAPATVAVSTLVTVTTEEGEQVEQVAWHAITVRRGETRWVGPAQQGSIVVQEAGKAAKMREVVPA
ncbi:hypothetical protein ACFQZ4_24100 [Catellatospora coxensis]|uniref:MerR-like DNA binding protein n=1 Tax=Catellatospora coxensis TaxID=310354 RepID=A0A8J3L2L1_9ACTN|nr:hypothetical protein [Catellatospora coxensis]GIG10199.1 hypothetical protein Cco03nite_68990 [Catellatospora coxensis]